MHRWVLHVDLDQFVAAVEVLRRPELAGRPVIVGGRGDPTQRAVVSTASYEARAFGVRSGMPLRIAARTCPEAVLLPVDGAAYTAASERVMATLAEHAPVQVLGWDEAFVGVEPTDADSARAFARRLQVAVLAATDLHCSIGVGDSTVRAKNATGFGKPRGVFTLTADTWLEVMGHRPTRDLWGVGPRVSARLAALGIDTVAELAATDLPTLQGEFGPKTGAWYLALGRGVGPDVVDPTPWVPRAHSRETTFQEDLVDRAAVLDAVETLARAVAADNAAEGRPSFRLFLKIRYAPFFTVTRSRTLPAPLASPDDLAAVARALADDRIEPDRPIRLLGVRAEMTPPDPPGCTP
ncbi:DNA polymerase IV [Agilicoccus flavus]|uniref:DNA polymerase IV n=1 Tax=Agilicoccus flavus TaxID=2775968 RepID=UPI001CF6B86A|nr:DNA polymerase IV [Agilicoccus flavus]